MRASRRLLALPVVAAAAVLVLSCAPSAPSSSSPSEPGASAPGATAPGASAPSSPTAAPDAAAALLEEAGDPAACAVTFAGEGIALDPVLATEGAHVAELPLPEREGAVFAGWYLDAEAAAALDVAQRVNIADVVSCDEDRRLPLHAAWTTPEETAAADVGVPILMYHQFTADPAGVDDPLRLNWAYAGDFEQHMAYLADEGYYLPSWRELSAFIDGRLRLPERSVIVTDDDAHASWFDLAVPVLDEHGVLATSFVITKWRSEPTPSPYVLQRSHTHDMHDPGADGRGRMVNWTPEEIAADLRTSADILGAAEVVAYPFGHYDERSKQGVADAGFEMAVTIEPGFVRPGADKLALPRVRIDYGMGLEAFIDAVS
ncbi:polysaccharide deacetylase family protein [Microbacterium sp. KNMS]